MLFFSLSLSHKGEGYLGGPPLCVLCMYLTTGVIIRDVDVHLLLTRVRFQFVLVRIGDAVAAADGPVDEREGLQARARAVLRADAVERTVGILRALVEDDLVVLFVYDVSEFG